jgi:hypothetical protein
MQIETPPTDVQRRPATAERRGLLIVHTGNGKGKSTAAFGLALRAHGRGKAVQVYQFMKVPSARFGEHRAFEQLGLPIEGLGDGFSWKSRDLQRSAQLALDGWHRAEATIRAGVALHGGAGRADLPACAMAGCRCSPCCSACASGLPLCTWWLRAGRHHPNSSNWPTP